MKELADFLWILWQGYLTIFGKLELQRFQY